LTVALAITLLVLVFARDIGRSAHGALSPRRSENRSFAALANALLAQENAFDGHLTYLLTTGGTLHRTVFAARLTQLDQELPLFETEAAQFRRPGLVHDVNDVAAQITEQRADDYNVLMANVASSLSLPWPRSTSPATLSMGVAQASLVATAREWNRARWGLVREPGDASLLALTDSSALLDYPSVESALRQSSSLALTRGIGIVAVSVSPAPLPAPAGELLLPPTSSMRLGVTVSNASYDVQPVSLTYVLSPTNRLGVSERQTVTVTLGPLQSYAFVVKALASVASEHAILTISLAGAPNGPQMSRLRRYTVIVSSSGNS
jgi:hypothetical protein